MSKRKETIYLKDYTSCDYTIESIHLTLELDSNVTDVTSKMMVRRINKDATSFFLNGDAIKLKSIKINNEVLPDNMYELSDSSLTISVDKDQFEVVIENENYPKKNLACDGLYMSGDVLCTQNEPEGFRRITFYQDRPDIMATFTTTLIGDSNKYPYMLANGNMVDQKTLSDGRKSVTWEDPHKKPCYLFAAVAGDLARVTDEFVTMSGRKVSLEFFVDKGNEDKCGFAIESLKNSMKWDEEKFGLEYDLDIYMVVAVDTFNFGAMENKGLNIFNSAYVLADAKSATDGNFAGIEAVIGHEYFHNWTGNRVTCRDWFQLTLKEGLTVFRDQEFSSDMGSRNIKRIEDVIGLRRSQFPEDAGANSHPIKPKSYIEINNFYTSTIYEKGAEIIRMIHTIIGKKSFRKGMDKYFELYDGQAVTTEDFVYAMELASGKDLGQFKFWYDQSGTPKVEVDKKYDSSNKTLTLTLTQSCKLNNDSAKALHIPLKIAAFDESGAIVKLNKASESLLELKQPIETFTFNDIESNQIILSLNRGFSAPVNIRYSQSIEDKIMLAANDTDSFMQYSSAYDVYSDYLTHPDSETKKMMILNMQKNILKREMDPSLKALLLTLPSEVELNQKLETFDFDKIHERRKNFYKEMSESHFEDFAKIYHGIKSEEDYQYNSIEVGKRSLKNYMLSQLSISGRFDDQLISHFQNATNMTDELSALCCLLRSETIDSTPYSEDFFNRWRENKLVLQKWYSAHAVVDRSDITSHLLEIESRKEFDKKIPNFLRSTVAFFASNNLSRFHASDGSGYKYVADKIIEIDSYNGSVAARISTKLGQLSKLDKNRRNMVTSELKRILEHKVSSDTFEIVSKNLNG